MNHNYLLLYLLGISIYLLRSSVARESIVGGNLALYSAIRYQVIILVSDRAPECGGGILKNLFVLTAAHCVIGPFGEVLGKEISILAGTDDLSVQGSVIDVEKFYVPEEYVPQHSIPIGDIAVLKLNEPLDMDKYNLIKLKLPSNKKIFYENTMAKIAGLGWDKIDENNVLIGEHSDHKLRFAEAKVRNKSECQHDHPSLKMSENHLCARVPQKDHVARRRGACLGDGGGPLVRLGQIAIGVLSLTTIGCSEKNSSAIYTRVSHYRDFILDSMIELGMSSTRIYHM